MEGVFSPMGYASVAAPTSVALLRELAMVCLTAVSGSGAHGNLRVPATRSRGNAMGGAATPGLFPEGRCTVPPGRISPVAREGTIGNRQFLAQGREQERARVFQLFTAGKLDARS